MRSTQSKTREVFLTDTPLPKQPSKRKQSQQRSITLERQPPPHDGLHPAPPDSVESSAHQFLEDEITLTISLPLQRKETMGESKQTSESVTKYHKLVLPGSGRGKKKKMSSLNVLFDRIKTEVGEEGERSEEGKSTKRGGRRRMCRLKTKQQFEEEYHSYLSRKEKENVAELFREVNRAMKVSERKNEGNIFFQNIRKDALNKIDYMYYNQKYYDDAEVRHLHSVVDSCNVLIHKKHSKIDAKPLYHLPPRSHPQQQRNPNSNLESTLLESKSTPWLKGEVGGSRRGSGCVGGSGTGRSQLVRKLGEIVSSCAQQKWKMREVRADMKIFGFYCDRVSSGMQSKETKLQNFLKWQELQ